MTARNESRSLLAHAERGQGVPLVLLHAFPADRRVWERQLDELSAEFRVITPDLRGFGQSSSEEPFTLESQAVDVRALLASIGALPCILSGLSMGGYIALAYARKYPADLRGLAVVDSKAEPDTPEAKQGRDQMATLARTAGARAVADQMLPKMLAPATQTAWPAVAARLRELIEACPPRTTEHALMAMRDRPDHTDTLSLARVPVLIVVGEHDAITPVGMAERMSKQPPNATLAVIPGAGHMSPMEQPALVSEALRRFAISVGTGG